MDFVDLHSHLLPGADDGAKSVEETLEMLRVAFAGGTRRIVATPHMFLPPFHNDDADRIRAAFAVLSNRITSLRAREETHWLRDMTIHLGAENYVSPEFFEALSERRIVPLNDGRCVLIEFSRFMTGEHIEASIHQVQEAGFCPILAHVERYPVFRDGPALLERLERTGCLLQINASSLRARRPRLRKLCLEWLSHGIISIVASDAHDTKLRTPDLSSAYRTLHRKFGRRRTHSWFVENPRLALAGQGR